MVRGERVRQAREAQALTQVELARMAEVEQPFLSLVEQNARQPSAEVLHRIALATGFPVAFFELPPGPDFPLGSLLYRGKRNVIAAEQAQIRQNARLILELVNLLEARFTPIDVRIPIRNDGDVSETASLARSVLGYSPDGPITNLMARLEKAGVLVYSIQATDAATTDAFSAWAGADGKRPVLVLTRPMPGDRQRFTLGHELGHLIAHQGFLSNKDLEKDADEFASEFLFPDGDAREELTAEPLTLTRLAKIKSRWGISMQALLYRAEALEVISPRNHSHMRAKMHTQGFSEVEPVPVTPERPKYVRQLIEAAGGKPVESRKVAPKFLSARFIDNFLAANEAFVTHMSKPTAAKSDADGADDGSPVLKFRKTRRQA